MAKKTASEIERTGKPRDDRIFNLDEEQAQGFLRDLVNPPPANDALRNLMKRTPPWTK